MPKHTYIIVSILLAVFMSGCGSIRTLAPNAETKLAYGSQYKHTDCESIPRMYSGVALDICMAFITKNGAFYTFDILMSGVIDTVALPYTLVMQTSQGSYKINSRN